MIFLHQINSRPGTRNKKDHIRKSTGEAVDRWYQSRSFLRLNLTARDADPERSRVTKIAGFRLPGRPETDGPAQPIDQSRRQVIGPMPRRQSVSPVVVQDIQPRVMRLASPFKAGLFFSLRRLMIWLYGVSSFLFGTATDKVLRRDSIDRRAVRLRECFAGIGGTFVKIGQQLSIRIDLIPYRYCVELTRLLDKADPFPSEDAIRIIESQTGRKISEMFAAFDPEPIGSASIACVYQAELHTGEKVAVKVRRPGVGETFMADLRVMGWIFQWLELATIIRPGFTSNVLQELRDTLLDELDFYKEARFQELFRRRARTAGRPFFSAPRVYPQFSGEQVMVQEFVSGIWLSELIAGVEHNHEPTLEHMRKLNIDPKLVARRLLWASHWGLWENVFFHADPHPANIIIRQDSRLVFIDFGASGSLTESRRLAMHELFAREAEEDLEGIARVALTLLEPLPPMDTDKVIHAIEKVFWDAMIAQRSEHSEWWEKTSANLWLGFFRVTNQFKIPMGLDHVRMIRATLLYDTLAARLDNQIDLGEQYRSFMRDAGKKAKKRLQKKIRQRVERGPTPTDYVKFERLLKMGDRALYLAQRVMNLRTYNFGALLGKFVSAVILLVTVAFQTIAATGIIVLAVYLSRWIGQESEPSFNDTIRTVISNPWYIAGLTIILLINVRRMLFRLSDDEVR